MTYNLLRPFAKPISFQVNYPEKNQLYHMQPNQNGFCTFVTKLEMYDSASFPVGWVFENIRAMYALRDAKLTSYLGLQSCEVNEEFLALVTAKKFPAKNLRPLVQVLDESLTSRDQIWLAVLEHLRDLKRHRVYCLNAANIGAWLYDLDAGQPQLCGALWLTTGTASPEARGVFSMEDMDGVLHIETDTSRVSGAIVLMFLAYEAHRKELLTPLSLVFRRGPLGLIEPLRLRQIMTGFTSKLGESNAKVVEKVVKSFFDRDNDGWFVDAGATIARISGVVAAAERV